MTKERLEILNKAEKRLTHYENAVIIAQGGMDQVRKSEYPSKVSDAMRTGLTREQQLHVASFVLQLVEFNERKVRAVFNSLT